MKCGIIDLGSNTIRLAVYQWEGDRFQPLLHQKSTAGVAGYVHNGALSPAGVAAAGSVLTRYRDLMEHFGVQEVHVFATASLRNISNTQQAAEALSAQTGLTVEVLSGQEEARLSFRGAVGQDGRSSGLLTDIGGGSFELVTFAEGAITGSCSRPLGSLSLYTQCVDSILPTPAEIQAMEEEVAAHLAQATVSPGPWPHLLGVGGTIRAADKLTAALWPSAQGPMTAQQIEDLCRLFSQGDRGTLRQVLHAVPDRVHTLLPGLLILRGILRTYGAETVTAAAGGIREGYLLERVMKV